MKTIKRNRHLLHFGIVACRLLPAVGSADDKIAKKPTAVTTLSADDFGVTTLTPPVLNVDPGPREL